jgi:uncharacterized protein (DUF433 family)
LAERGEALMQADSIIHSEKGFVGGEPVFRGTRIPVQTVAAMKLQGAATDEIIEGYPALTARMVDSPRSG